MEKKWGENVFGNFFFVQNVLEVDKITWGSFSKNKIKSGADGLFGRKERWGALFLNGVEKTAPEHPKLHSKNMGNVHS
jgi:hypothetical protein